MTLFQDTDGSAYVIFASNLNRDTRIVRLTDDYLDPTTDETTVFRGVAAHSGRESPAVFRHNDLYFFIGSGCSGWSANAAEYAVTASLMGAWSVKGNPCVGDGADRTFDSQNTFVLPVAGKPGAFILLADRWKPNDIGDSRYVWLPIAIEGDTLTVRWHDAWDMSVFDGITPAQ